MIALEEYSIGNLKIKNRIVMAPMCMYTADNNGFIRHFHRNHYAARAMGGTGLIILEASAVTPNGRISSSDIGIWSDEHIEGLKSIVDESKAYGSKIGIQLAHAGRKSTSDDEYIVAPSPIPFNKESRLPRELNLNEIKTIINDFKNASIRADKSGFDLIEIHAAHGYLIHEFLSPISNKRTDEYGGNLKNRTRFLKEILIGVKEVWPKHKPILVRVSADDYDKLGIDKYMMVEIINEVKEYIDMVHVSTGGLIERRIDSYPGYQLAHAELIKEKCDIPTIAVGLINEYDHIEEILKNNRADMVALGRALLRDPHFVNQMAFKYNENSYPIQYERAYIKKY